MSYGLTTRVLHADRQGDIEHGAVHKPMHPSAAYRYDDVNDLVGVFQNTRAGYSYARQGTPTTAALEAKVNLLEGGRGTVSFATGMGALAALFTTLLRAGDHLVSSQYIFGNTNSLLGTLQALGVEVSMVDATDAQAVAQAIRPNTRMVFVETIANPGTQIADLAGIGELCRERGLLYVVDNTISTPYLYRPAVHGAGLVMNSLTKYICGHGNALGGAITDTGCFDWSNYPGISEVYRKGDPANWGLMQLRKKGLRDMGATLSSESAHRIAVGAETLALRMERACHNALTLARRLAEHPGVARVHYAGLATHPQHARATEYFGVGVGEGRREPRYGALLSVELAEGLDCLAFLNALDIVVLSTHLGDSRTLALPAAHTIYHEMGPVKRAQMGIPDSLVRVSVGIEDTADLVADFERGLAAVMDVRRPAA
ncbi:cystathionine gamma-synthase family protein [Verticiella sediminum]